MLIFPVTCNTLVALLNVKFALASALPAVLKITCVFPPGIVRLPVMLPKNVPTKYPSVTIFPVAEIIPGVFIDVAPIILPPSILPVADTFPLLNTPVLPIKLPPITFPVVDTLALEVNAPDNPSAVKVPTEVILGCAAVAIAP